MLSGVSAHQARPETDMPRHVVPVRNRLQLEHLNLSLHYKIVRRAQPLKWSARICRLYILTIPIERCAASGFWAGRGHANRSNQTLEFGPPFGLSASFTEAEGLKRDLGASPSYSRRSSIWCLRGFWDLGAHGFVRLFHRLTTDTFANALEG